MTTASGFGLLRFVTGLGAGALVATTGAIVAEFPHPGRRTSATPSSTPAWLLSRGRVGEARAISQRTGITLTEAPPAAVQDGGRPERVGFAGLFSGTRRRRP